MSAFLIGCAGWSLARQYWSVFPDEGTHLQRYAARFNAVEINSSFYRPHRPETYARWAESVPEGFRFSVKLPRTISHEWRLHDCESLLKVFLEQCTQLGDKLGCLLIQLPPSFRYDADIAQRFFALLRYCVTALLRYCVSAMPGMRCLSRVTSPGCRHSRCWSSSISGRLPPIRHPCQMVTFQRAGKVCAIGDCMARRRSTTALMVQIVWPRLPSSYADPGRRAQRPGACSTIPPAVRRWGMRWGCKSCSRTDLPACFSCVRRDAERPERHSHAERGNDHCGADKQ